MMGIALDLLLKFKIFKLKHKDLNLMNLIIDNVIINNLNIAIFNEYINKNIM